MFGESEILRVQVKREVEVGCDQGGKEKEVAIAAGAEGEKRGGGNYIDNKYA